MDAQRRWRRLITQDTLTGDNAEPPYASLGYRTVGVIPESSRRPVEDRSCSTTIMCKAP